MSKEEKWKIEEELNYLRMFFFNGQHIDYKVTDYFMKRCKELNIVAVLGNDDRLHVVERSAK